MRRSGIADRSLPPHVGDGGDGQDDQEDDGDERREVLVDQLAQVVEVGVDVAQVERAAAGVVDAIAVQADPLQELGDAGQVPGGGQPGGQEQGSEAVRQRRRGQQQEVGGRCGQQPPGEKEGVAQVQAVDRLAVGQVPDRRRHQADQQGERRIAQVAQPRLVAQRRDAPHLFPQQGQQAEDEDDGQDRADEKDGRRPLGQEGQAQAQAEEKGHAPPLKAVGRQQEVDGQGDHGRQGELQVKVAGHGVVHGKDGQQGDGDQPQGRAAPAPADAIGRGQGDGQVEDVDHGGDVGVAAEQPVHDRRRGGEEGGAHRVADDDGEQRLDGGLAEELVVVQAAGQVAGLVPAGGGDVVGQPQPVGDGVEQDDGPDEQPWGQAR